MGQTFSGEGDSLQAAGVANSRYPDIFSPGGKSAQGGGWIASDVRWALQSATGESSGSLATPASFGDLPKGTDTSAQRQRQPTGEAASNSPLAEYLRRILAREESLQAAFQPVLAASLCQQTGTVDRAAFALAVARIKKHFDPSEPTMVRAPASSGLPYTREEAFAEFFFIPPGVVSAP